MTMTRREWLESVTIAGLGATLPYVSACGGTAGDGLPHYAYTGTRGPATMFELGVASGDSLADAVVLWTHLSPAAPGAAIDVWVEVATDTAFRHRVVATTFPCDATTDYTLKVDIGELDAGSTYYYRFFAEGVESPSGRTKTLPSGSTAHLRFGIVSCSNYGYGYFYAYRRLAERADLDAIFHLGDYIYEYQNGFYPFPGNGDVRTTDPLTEIVSLADYRKRYFHYRTDPDLQEAHRQHPWFTIWDDHEVANDSYETGAQNHQPMTEGLYSDRKAAAKQAYFEYLPIRGVVADGIMRTARFGDLVDVIFLDTRLEGRSQQINDPATDTASRSMLGAAQEAWLDTQLMNSTSKWRILAQQVCVAQFTYDSTNHVPAYLDQWDGYPMARTRLFDSIDTNGQGNVVVLTGDLHGACAFELTPDPWTPASYNPATGAGAIAVEFVGTSVTSPYLAFGTVTTEPAQLAAACPHMKWCDLNSNGFMIVDITPQRVQTDYFKLDGLDEFATGKADFEKGFSVADGTAHLVEEATEAPPKAGAPRLAS